VSLAAAACRPTSQSPPRAGFLLFGARISNEQSTKYRFHSELFRDFLLLTENLF
jgi:hypothetical protein